MVNSTVSEKACRKRTHTKFYSTGEEIANALTHGLACAASVVGLVFLILYAIDHGTTLHVSTLTIFGSSLIILYLASTLYHAVTHTKIKRYLQLCDHSAIFLLIAGSYTPFMLNFPENTAGVAVCIAVWAIALFGIVFQPWLIKKGDKLNTLLYLIQGWLVVLAIKPVCAALPDLGLTLLIAGGLLYSFGCIFYMWHRLPYHHAVWHLFVVGGSTAHYFAVMQTV